jgi:hypothetical protein
VGSNRWREPCCLILFFLSYASSVIPVHASVLYLACPCLRAIATATPLSELVPWKFVLSCHVTDAAARTYFSFLYAYCFLKSCDLHATCYFPTCDFLQLQRSSSSHTIIDSICI